MKKKKITQVFERAIILDKLFSKFLKESFNKNSLRSLSPQSNCIVDKICLFAFIIFNLLQLIVFIIVLLS